MPSPRGRRTGSMARMAHPLRCRRAGPSFGTMRTPQRGVSSTSRTRGSGFACTGVCEFEAARILLAEAARCGLSGVTIAYDYCGVAELYLGLRKATTSVPRPTSMMSPSSWQIIPASICASSGCTRMMARARLPQGAMPLRTSLPSRARVALGASRGSSKLRAESLLRGTARL